MAIKDEILDELLADYRNPEDLLGQDGIFNELKKRLLERALGAELTDHLGYEKGDRNGGPKTNCRNGHSSKKVKGQAGELEIAVPRAGNQVSIPKSSRKARAGSTALTTRSSRCTPEA